MRTFLKFLFVLDFLLINYPEKESGEKELFKEVKSNMDSLIMKRYKDSSIQLQLANMLSVCVKKLINSQKYQRIKY